MKKINFMFNKLIKEYKNFQVLLIMRHRNFHKGWF